LDENGQLIAEKIIKCFHSHWHYFNTFRSLVKWMDVRFSIKPICPYIKKYCISLDRLGNCKVIHSFGN